MVNGRPISEGVQPKITELPIGSSALVLMDNVTGWLVFTYLIKIKYSFKLDNEFGSFIYKNTLT